MMISENRDISSIDFSVLTNLVNLDVCNCGLTEFDLGPLAGRLQYLRISLNKIPSLDVSSAQRLTRLEAYGIKQINVSGLIKKGLLVRFLHDESSEVIDNDPPVTP